MFKKKSVISLELSESAEKQRRRRDVARPTIKQPLLRFRSQESERKRRIGQGLKDLCSDDRQASKRIQLSWVRSLDTVLPVCNPDHPILLAWNILVQAAILYNMLMTPIVIFFTEQAFQFDTQTAQGQAINILFLIIFYLDILLQFNVGYYGEGKLVRSRTLVFTRYIKLQFWIDLASTIAITIYLASPHYSFCYVRLACYLKIINTFTLDAQILQSLAITRFWIVIYRFVRITILLWFLTTWAACIFFAIDYRFYLEQSTYYRLGQLWLTNSQATNYLNIITSFPWFTWYEYALYWSIQTSSTIGYGDLTAKNPEEIIYCNFVMLLMTVFFAYFINSVWQIIGQLQQGPLQYTNHWHALRLYLHSVPLPKYTKQKISNYMHEVFKENDTKQIQDMIIENVSQQLKLQFLVGIRIKFFKTHHFFAQLLKETSQNNKIWLSLVSILQQHCFGQGTIIYIQGQYDPYSYYLRSGLVKLQIRYSELGRTIQSDQIFGSQQFFTQTTRNHDAQAVTFVRIWKISYESMRSILKQYEQIYQNFCKWSDSINIEKQQTQMQFSECWRCLNRDHFIERCPLISYLPKLHLNLISTLIQLSDHSPRSTAIRLQGKSNKILYIKSDRDRSLDVDRVHNFNFYLPEHNLRNLANINRNTM